MTVKNGDVGNTLNTEPMELASNNKKDNRAVTVNENVENKKAIQIFATVSGSITKFETGMMVAWTSPALPKLFAEDSPIPLTSSQGSWVAGCLQVGSIVSVFLMAVTVDVIGRKRGILFSAIPVFACWILIVYANSAEMLYASRFIGGLGGGYGKVVIGTYIGEIAEPHLRGALGTFMGVTYNLGILFSYCVGPYVSISTFACIATLAPVLMFFTFMWMPETPYFYVMREDMDKARSTLEQLRGHVHVDAELDRISKGVEKRPRFRDSFKKLVQIKSNLNALVIIVSLNILIQFSGKIPIIAYSQTIFKQAGGDIPPHISSIITGIVQLLALVISTLTVDRYGRKPLLTLSCLGSGLALGSLGIYFYLQDILHVDVSQVYWLPLTALIIYNFVFNIGLGNIPFIMVGELFPTDVKSVAVGLTSLVLPTTSILNIKMYQIVVDTYGIYTAFFWYAIVCFIGSAYSYFQVPETKGKSLEEIQEFLILKSKSPTNTSTEVTRS